VACEGLKRCWAARGRMSKRECGVRRQAHFICTCARPLSVVSVSSSNRIRRVEGRRNERESAVSEARDGDGYLTRNWPMSVRWR
jgi:hypothetical protein